MTDQKKHGGKQRLTQSGREKRQLMVLLGAWLVLVLAFLGKPEKIFSEAENRYLQRRPKWSLASFEKGIFGEELEKWISDQLPGRDGWVQGKTLLARFLGRRENQGIYFGREEYLLETFQEYDQKLFAENLTSVARLFKLLEDTGTKGYLLLAPTAGAVMPSHLPAYAPELDQDQLFSQAEEHVPGVIRVEEALRAHQEEYIYYRTDHHWTSLGAYYAYEAFRKQTGREAFPREAYTEEILSRDFYGTSYPRAGSYAITPDWITAMYLPGREKPSEVQDGNIQKEEELSGDPKMAGQMLTVDYGNGETEQTLYDRSFLKKRDQYRVFLKGNYPLVTIHTGVENGKKLLLIKDSYANTFVQFLVSDYEEIQMVDLRYFKASLTDYAAKQKFTEVLVLYQIKNFVQESISFQ